MTVEPSAKTKQTDRAILVVGISLVFCIFGLALSPAAPAAGICLASLGVGAISGAFAVLGWS